MKFEPVDPRVSFPELERRISGFWEAEGIFRKSLERRIGAPEWVFYDGPPTANAKPHIGHALTRTFKDIFPRYRTMAGYYVHRKAGWDCHGLPVEIEVEKEIGTKGKRDIEEFGVAEFNRLCRESVRRYVRDWEALTDRIGFWLDMSDAYWTMNTEYIESVWWSLKQLHSRGLLSEADKVTAYCPRCGTALSDAEVALGYETVADPSVFVKLPIVEAQDRDLVGTNLLIWTTTPWTLPSNEGVAVDPTATYQMVRFSRTAQDGQEGRFPAGEDRFWVAKGAPLGQTLVVEGERLGSELIGLRYVPPYPNVDGAHRVVAGDFVTMDEGTGLVHMAPAFGAPDLAVGSREGWPVFKPVGDDGTFNDQAPEFVRGKFVKEADPAIVDDLRERGLLLLSETYEHSYPFCWRCHTPLLYYARTAWYIRTTEVKDRLLAVNDDVDWHPEHLRHGRYGNWLENNVDWALSRERYWGTPLPVWRCASDHQTAIGSLTELSRLAGRDLSQLDPHRPYIDEVTFDCEHCGEESRRVPEVIDAWYDSGAMPFAQWGYHPELGRGAEEFAKRFPADFISEAIDQTRGWFYTLMAEAVLHFDSTAYRSVVCFGFITDEEGRKMSKSLGNVMDPMSVFESHGADALRWLLLTTGSPWTDRRLSPTLLDDAVRQFLLTLWNVYSFFVIFANASGFDPDEPAPPLSQRPPLDRWIASRLNRTVTEVREGLDSYDATTSGRRIGSFVDDLSNWYVRRSRRRFWDPGGTGGEDSTAAFATLWECLTTVSQLLAPFTPFISEELWRNLASWRDGEPASVHLCDFPRPEPSAVDEPLEAAMQTARRLVELGRRVRVQTKSKTRQPLSEALVQVSSPGHLEPLLRMVADELNVKSVVIAGPDEAFGVFRAKPDYRRLGPRFGSRVTEVAEALQADDGGITSQLLRGETVEISGLAVSPEDVVVSRDVPEGWGVASDGELTVALDLELTDELRSEGFARELVRAVQDERKEAGLDVSDRIELGLEVPEDLSDALEAHRDLIAGETLAIKVVRGVVDGGRVSTVEAGGRSVRVSLRKV